MVSVSKLVNNGLLLVNQAIYKDVATPQQAAIEAFNVINFMGGAGPYIQRPSYGISADLPDQCEIKQVQLISRHGARYPTISTGKGFKSLYDKFQNYNGTFKGDLAFLNDYEFFVHDSDLYEKETTAKNSEGTYAGTNDMLIHGAAFRSKYNDIFNENQTLLVFTSNSGRIHMSSKYFARGFLGDDYEEDKVLYSIINEEDSMGANSLTPSNGCAALNDSINDELVNQYDSSYLEGILTRLVDQNPGLNLTTSDISKLFPWCAYELNVNGSSPFCSLFTNDELIHYSYSVDLDKYYLVGPANNLTATAASPLLNASLSLLKDDSNPNKVWLSFVHDGDVYRYLTAVGLVNLNNTLPVDHIPFPIPYQNVQIAPQGARIYTEKFQCSNETYVRYIVNDAVMPIESCQNGPGFSCKFADFEAYIEKQLEGNSYADNCNVAEGVPTELTFYWDYVSKNYTAEDINS